MKKSNNKGFTLVELIVVLVILAILAAILVPALLGYIDRAREKQVTTNAEAALVAAQGKMADAYATYAVPSTEVNVAKIKALTDIDENFEFAYFAVAHDPSKPTKAMYKITDFAYYSDVTKQTAIWHAEGDNAGQWVVYKGKVLAANSNAVQADGVTQANFTTNSTSVTLITGTSGTSTGGSGGSGTSTGGSGGSGN